MDSNARGLPSVGKCFQSALNLSLTCTTCPSIVGLHYLSFHRWPALPVLPSLTCTTCPSIVDLHYLSFHR
ncbi:hypothetical protein ACOMHN_000161 [Nucella lapillus]